MKHPTFKRYGRGERLSAQEYNRVVGTVAANAGSLHIQGYADSTGFHTRRFPAVAAEPPGVKELRGHVCIRCTVRGRLVPRLKYVRCAKIQTGGVPSNNTGPFTCKLIDGTGTEEGDAISVYVDEHLGTNDFDSGNVHPSYVVGEFMTVYWDFGKWYTMNVFEDTIDCVRTAPP